MTASDPYGALKPAAVIGSLLGRRRLFLELARRDLRARFAGARFGLLWSLINPVLQLASYGLIFGFVYRTQASDSQGALVASLFCGLWPWWAFQDGTMRGLGALVDQAGLLKKFPLPLELCILAPATVSFALQMAGFLVFLAVFGALGVVAPSPRWLLLPFAVLLELALVMGAALLLAPIHLVVRDTVHVVTAVLLLGFFASPVLYSSEALPSALRTLQLANPMATVIGMYRYIVIGDPAPTMVGFAVLLAAIAATWAVGARLLANGAQIIDEHL